MNRNVVCMRRGKTLGKKACRPGGRDGVLKRGDLPLLVAQESGTRNNTIDKSQSPN